MEDQSEGANRIVILGGGRGGNAMLEMLNDEPLANVIAVVDTDPNAAGIIQAKTLGITVYNDVGKALEACAPCLAFNLTNSDTAERVACAALGIGSVVGGIEARLIWRMVTDLKSTKKDLEYQVAHDLLTGLYNRRFVMEQMQREFSQAIRYTTYCSLVLIDLDNFKNINDTYGHLVGDLVLRRVSDELHKNVRATDILGRWGGEEFIVLLPHTKAHDAKVAAQLWLQKVQSLPIDLATGETLRTSFSAGVAELKVEKNKGVQEHIEILLELVDRRLYQAKAYGKACIVGEEKS